jgi:hypothetical protein
MFPPKAEIYHDGGWIPALSIYPFTRLGGPDFGSALMENRSGAFIYPITADFNKFHQRSTPLLPKQVKRFIEVY